MSKKFIVVITICIGILLLAGRANTQILAFPGAEGFGKFTSGGRGGSIFIVSNLNDSGTGSLREAIEQKGPRTIVFTVSGTIDLQSPLQVNNGDLTIAGQSAPGEGITLKNYPLKISSDNVIIRYIRSRLGDEKEQEADALSSIRNKDIIIDHCSFSWGTDESASCYDNENFTMQWCIISESLNNSVHAKGEHGYGGIWGGKGASFHHNILAHHKSRTPRFNGERTQPKKKELVDFRNNVIYNWKANSAYAGEKGEYNLIANYYKPGPATQGSKKKCIINPWKPYGKFYLHGNFFEGAPHISANNNLGVVADDPQKAIWKDSFAVEVVRTYTAEEAYSQVLAQAGASFRRDQTDHRIIAEISSGTAKYGRKKDGIIDSQKDVGGWPILKSGTAIMDKDKDGMPDNWESENYLDPTDPHDHAAYSLNENYTNIEVYLNGLIEKQNEAN